MAAALVIRVRREPDRSRAVVYGRRLASGSARNGNLRDADWLRAFGQPPVVSKLRGLSSAWWITRSDYS